MNLIAENMINNTVKLAQYKLSQHRVEGTKSKPVKTTNNEGAKAFKIEANLKLYADVCTSFFNNKFYQSRDLTVVKVLQGVAKINSKFPVCKLALATVFEAIKWFALS